MSQSRYNVVVFFRGNVKKLKDIAIDYLFFISLILLDPSAKLLVVCARLNRLEERIKVA